MKLFFFKLFIFVSFAILVASLNLLFISKKIDERFDWKNFETESSFLVARKPYHYDLVFLGSSHGKIFSRDKNHLKVEQILNKKILNLSNGGGGGVVPAKINLSYFFDRGNSTEQIIYFIDPFVFYSRKWNEEFHYDMEPFNVLFLNKLIENNVGNKSIFYYLKSKFELFWFFKKPYSNESNDIFLTEVNAEAIEKRVENIYPDGQSEYTFKHYVGVLEDIIKLSQNNNSEIIFIISPTLLGNYKKLPELKQLLSRYEENYSIKFYDFSESILDTALYSDHDHLNTEGIKYFTSFFLKSIFVDNE